MRDEVLPRSSTSLFSQYLLPRACCHGCSFAKKSSKTIATSGESAALEDSAAPLWVFDQIPSQYSIPNVLFHGGNLLQTPSKSLWVFNSRAVIFKALASAASACVAFCSAKTSICSVASLVLREPTARFHPAFVQSHVYLPSANASRPSQPQVSFLASHPSPFTTFSPVSAAGLAKEPAIAMPTMSHKIFLASLISASSFVRRENPIPPNFASSINRFASSLWSVPSINLPPTYPPAAPKILPPAMHNGAPKPQNGDA